ncbi:MAG: prolipoprotein diacylglyceryl transferase [Acidobacteria bacterium]|nr:MAG: prolipoprotein diacylglyceryl transferase [Acidobacteriota bacterium]
MIAFHIFGRPVYRYGIMYLIGFVVGRLFLEYVTKHRLIEKVSPTLQTILTDNVDTLMTYIIIGGILGGRLGEVLIYEPHYYRTHPNQILATRNGGMSFIGGIIGALIAVTIFLHLHKSKKSDFLTLTDLLAVIAPFGIALGRIGNRLNRELYGPVIESTHHLYPLLQKLHLLYDYGTTELFQNELRLNTNFLASFGE